MVCDYCGESVLLGEPSETLPLLGDPTRTTVTFHLACQLRQVVGSVGHQLKRCTCYGGTEEDPPGLTKREAAKLAGATFERLHRAPAERAP